VEFKVYCGFGKLQGGCVFIRPSPVCAGWTPRTDDRGLVRKSEDKFGAKEMAQVCDICGKGPQFGNNISHAHNVTKRRWNVNLQAVKALVNGAPKRIRVCTSCIKSGKIKKT
jgi:large subunit ribosomal protein L28